MIGYANDDPDWPGPPIDPPDEDTRWATGGTTSTDDDLVLHIDGCTLPDDHEGPCNTP